MIGKGDFFMKRLVQAISLVLALSMAVVPVRAAGAGADAASVGEETARYLLTAVSSPRVASVGGGWTVLGLARGGFAVPDGYFASYVKAVEDELTASEGVLNRSKYTDYSRVVLALTSIGKDPTDVAGYNLLSYLADFDKVCAQGVNGPAYALLALDSGDYEIPQNPEAAVQATRERYLQFILDSQLPDGGFALTGESSDPDVTGMAVQALARYQDRPEAKAAVDKALGILSEKQDSSGGYQSWGQENSESVVQVIMALCELGIDPAQDTRFIKNGRTLIDRLMDYYLGGGRFAHVDGGAADLMATEQGLYALVNLLRVQAGKPSVYRMTDAAAWDGAEDPAAPQQGLPNKHPAVKPCQVIDPDKTFADVEGHANQAAIEALAARGVINGMTETAFAPESTMTRAQYAAIVTRALGLDQASGKNFSDVARSAWYYSAVQTASAYGIVNGVTADSFQPEQTISRQEAAVMTARAAKLCGLDTALDDGYVQDVLSQFGDYTTAAAWARGDLAYCYESGILSQQELNIEPARPIKRCEVAQMVWNLIEIAQLAGE